MDECLLCLEDLDFVGIGKCNHACICYKCISKCRSKLKNKQCPICKEELQEVIISKTIKKFE